MSIKNKPLVDKFWDNHQTFLEQVVEFNDVAPKNKTQIFVFSPETALAAEKLVRSETFKFPPIEEIRLPYPNTVIEIAITPEILALRNNGVNGTTPIVRIGGYLEEVCFDKMRVITCTPYWEFEDGRIQQSAFTFACGDVASIQTEKFLMAGGFLLNTKNSAEGAVNTRFFLNRGVSNAIGQIPVARKAFLNMRDTPEVMTHIKESAIEVPLLMFACSMLLTCKSGITKTGVKPRKPTFAGLGNRMRKKMSSSGYTVIHITAMENVSSDDGTISARHEVAAHYVRGHFKQRKRGVYWWNPFVRGTGEPRIRTSYEVKE